MVEQNGTFEIRDRRLDDYFRILLKHSEYNLVEMQNSRMVEILRSFAKAQTGQVPENLREDQPTIFEIVKYSIEGIYTIPKCKGDNYRATVSFQNDSNLVNILDIIEERGGSWVELRNEADRVGDELRSKYNVQHPSYFARDGAGFAHKMPSWNIGLLGLVIRGALECESDQKIKEYFDDLNVKYSRGDLQDVLLLRERAIKLIEK